MRSRLLPVLAAGALTFSLLGPVSAHAEDPDLSLPSVDGPGVFDQTAAEHAAEVLDQAQALVEESPHAESPELRLAGPDATSVFNQLVRVRDDLSPAGRQQADALLARPTESTGRDTGEYDPGTTVLTECTADVCVHWAVSGKDAPPAGDADANDIPDSIDHVLETAQDTAATFEGAGYQRPDRDGTRGGDSRPDLYLADLGSGLYGYTQPEGSGLHRESFIVIDNDFDGFLAPFEDVADVTIAHEYFHAIQYAYDAFEDLWIAEATATWAEDELYDDVDDNVQYLRFGQLRQPRIPLDRFDYDSNVQYGNWIFFRYLTEQWRGSQGGLPVLVRKLWEQLSARPGAPDRYSTQGLHQVLAARGTSFTDVYGRFADANRRPATTYDEGASYPVAQPERTWTMSSRRRQVRGFYAKLDHLTNLPLRYRVGRSLRKPDWRLKLIVDPPAAASAPVVRVAIHKKNGRVSTSSLRLRSRGASSKTVPFSTRNVRYVEMVLVNASRRMRSCWSAGQFDAAYYSCYGRSRDNNRRFDFNVKALRR